MTTTETEMQHIIGSILWTSGKVFVGNTVSESDHPGLVVKTVDGSEFNISIAKVR